MIGAPKQPAPAAALANVTPQKLDTNEQARPVGWFSGRRWQALEWIQTQIYNPVTTPLKTKVGKGSTTTTYSYSGDLVGLCCLGPVDFLEAIEADGQIVWSAPGGISRDGSHVDSTGDIVIPGFGTFRLYWGTETQVLDTLVLSGSGETHPRYLGFCYLVGKGVQFGTGRLTPPNIRVMLERSPRFGGLLDEDRSREGANLVTAAAELLGNDFYGLGRPDLVDVTTWSALAATQAADELTLAIPDDPAHAALMSYASPYLDRQQAASAIFGAILENFDGWIRRLGSALEIGAFPHDGVVPTGLPELTLHDDEQLPDFDSPGFTDTITDSTVKYPDRDWNMQDQSVPGMNSAARERVGETRNKSFDRPFIITSYQARRQAAELVNFFCWPETSVTLTVRREKAVGLLPGDRFVLNYSPSSFEQIMRVTGRRDPGSGGTIDLSIVAERGLAPLAFVPPSNPAPDLPAPPAAVAIAHGRIFELPAAWVGTPIPTVVPLATRPSVNTLGFIVNYSLDDLTYDVINNSQGWALYGTLAGSMTSGAASLTVNASGPDLAILAAQSAAEQADDALLLIVDSEVMAIGAVTAIGGGQYTLAVLRARRGSAAATHANTAPAFIVRRADLLWLQNANFPTSASALYFKLAAFTPGDEQDLSAALRIVFTFESRPVSPPTSITATAKAEAIFLAWVNPLERIKMTWVYERTAATPVPDPTTTAPDFQLLATGFNRGGLAAGATRYYFFVNIDDDDKKSAITSVVSATALAAATGPTGPTGNSVEIRYIRNPTAPSTPTGDNPTGWTVAMPSGTDLLWASNSVKDPAGHLVGVWSTPQRITGDTGATGTTGATGPTGDTGPGIVYRGVYDAAKAYSQTATRRDVVLYSGTYYLTNNAAKNGLTTWGTPGGADWTTFGSVFSSVATDLLLAQDVTILKSLVMGDGSTADAGIIRSNGCSDYTTGTGFFIGNVGTTAKVRFGSTTQYARWTGTGFEIKGAYFEISSATCALVVDIDPGFVGPNPPARFTFGGVQMIANGSTQTVIGLSGHSTGIACYPRPSTGDEGVIIAAGDVAFAFGGAFGWKNWIRQDNGEARFSRFIIGAYAELQGTSQFVFSNNGALTSYLAEDYGVNLHGDSSHPIQIPDAALAMFNSSGSVLTPGRIYLTSSVYLYESGGNLYGHGASGNVLLA